MNHTIFPKAKLEETVSSTNDTSTVADELRQKAANESRSTTEKSSSLLTLYSPTGERHFYERVGEILKDTRINFAKFEQLHVFDLETKRRLTPMVRHHLIRSAGLRAQILGIIFGWMYCIWIPSLVVLLGIPLMLNQWLLHLTHSFWGWVGVYVAYFIAFYIVFFIIAGPSFLSQLSSNRLFRKRSILYLCYSWTAVASCIDIFLLVKIIRGSIATQASLVIQAAITGLLAYAFIFISIGFCALALLAILPLTERRASSRYPDTVVITELLNTLYLLENQPQRWTAFDFKRDLMLRLENTATCLQHYLPRCLRSGDAATDAWMENSAQRMAAALRSMKKDILAPKMDSRDNCLEHLKINFTCAVTGDWDGFERSELEALSSSQVLNHVREISLTLMRGSVPLLILWLIQKTSLALSGTTLDYAMLICVAWLTLTLLPLIDPNFRGTLGTLKEVRDILKI